MRRSLVPLAVLAIAAGMTPLSASAQQAPDPAVAGSFGPVFQQPQGVECRSAQDPAPRCKPAAMALSSLPNGKQFYYNGLEGMNKVDYNVVAEYGHEALNGQSRVMDLNGGDPQWSTPPPFDGGANPEGNDEDNEYLPGVPNNNSRTTNDGDLFCSDLNFLADGRVIANGGTSYYQEPGVPGDGDEGEFGVVELNGLKNTRIFDPRSETWSQAGDMEFARWYPSMVTQPDGSQLTFSGVTKLIKPAYPERPQDSAANERHVERFDPDTGQWTTLPDSAKKSLPLYPRLHLLPNGKTFYNGAGQTFNPFGQAIDEATWNFTSVFDPATDTWEDKGLNDFGGAPLGFRGSGFSVMLPLEPGRDGGYSKADLLSAGGVYGVSPGTYLATDTSTLTSIDTADGDAMTSEATGRLNSPRWYGNGTMLPTGEVLVTSGGDRDHVIQPGLEAPVRTTEIYDPETGEWTETAPQTRGRTYHNTASLLPDGRVLVGGHAPIGSNYAMPTDAYHDTLGFSKPYVDPTFQIFSPPYLHWGERPVITGVDPAVRTGETMDVEVDDPEQISSIRMLRNTSVTHVVDSDQRNVELKIVGRDGDSVQVVVPDNKVLPPGPYMLFAHRDSEQGEIPSVSRQVFVDAGLSEERISELEATEQAEQAEQEPGAVPGESAPVGTDVPLPGIGAALGFGGLLALGGTSVGRHRARKRHQRNRHRATV